MRVKIYSVITRADNGSGFFADSKPFAKREDAEKYLKELGDHEWSVRQEEEPSREYERDITDGLYHIYAPDDMFELRIEEDWVEIEI